MRPNSSHVLCLAVELLQNEVTEKLPSESENLQLAFSRLQQALSKAYQYVDDVVVSRMGGHVHCLSIKCLVRNQGVVSTW